MFISFHLLCVQAALLMCIHLAWSVKNSVGPNDALTEDVGRLRGPHMGLGRAPPNQEDSSHVTHKAQHLGQNYKGAVLYCSMIGAKSCKLIR